MNVKIIVDSTCDHIDKIKEKLIIVPLSIHFGEDEYTDGITISKTEFYEKLAQSDVIPTTSQIAPAFFSEVFERETKDGSSLVVITLAKELSGTYQSAMIAKEDFSEKVFVVDSKNVAIGAGILAEYALKLKEEDKTAEEIAGELEKERENIRLVALLDTLEYLKHGGRISKTTATIGGLLSIKPVICVKDGEISLLGKARGSKHGNNLLLKEIENMGGIDFNKPFLLGYTGVSDDLLQNFIKDSGGVFEENAQKPNSTIIGSVVGTHAGPGAVAAAFFKV